MTQTIPITQSPHEDLLNALQIADAVAHVVAHDPKGDKDMLQVLEGIARLIRHAMEQFGEPNLAAVQAAATMLRELGANTDDPTNFENRYARDTAAAILKAAMSGEIPKTWSEP